MNPVKRLPLKRGLGYSPKPQPAVTVSRGASDHVFLIWLYLGTVAIRLLVGFTIMATGNVPYFGGDHQTYDYFGWGLAEAWAGNLQSTRWLYQRTSLAGQNGMFYWVGAIYYLFGHSEYIAVLIQVSIISLTPLFVYGITQTIFGSRQAARIASALTAFLPSMVIWSCVLLKDPIVLLLITMTVFYTLKLQKEVKIRYIWPTSLAMLLVFPIRGYVFYFVLTSVLGSLLMARFGRKASSAKYFIRLAGIAAIIIFLFMLGFDRIAAQQIDTKLLERIQMSRLDLARNAQSGFDTSADVSTIGGALAFLPKGIAYLLFAPFPWQVSGGSRMYLAMPEVLLWYLAFPFCLAGIFYTVRRHFREALVVFVFVIQLTVFYSIFIGNVGTAHRQRTQVLGFYLIFTSVGWVHFVRRRNGIPGSIAQPPRIES
jgi:4-amino-4-deoxy-L-arabinose transferase-like glycosyltransferase